MRVCGIIAEYNPFHNGHLYQLAHVREELKADYIVVAMSGNYVQRGEPALMEKHARARMALLSGADLVLELPVSTSTASAEGFASGGVQLLSSLGVVNMLCFGAETDDLPLLTAAASVLFDEPDDFRTVLREKLSEGRSFAEARAEALRHVMPGEDRLSGILASPNNILALEYLKAIRRYGRGIEPCLLVRSGSAYGSESLEAGLYPSATAIRRRIREGLEAGITADELMLSLAPHMPEDALRVLDEAVRTGGIFPSTGLDEALRYRLFMEEPGTLVRYLDVDEPLARRIGHLRYQYQGAAAFAKLLKSRHELYNAALDYLAAREAAGAAFVIRPSRPLEISRMEADVEKIEASYALGRQDAETALEPLKKWLEEKADG